MCDPETRCIAFAGEIELLSEFAGIGPRPSRPHRARERNGIAPNQAFDIEASLGSHIDPEMWDGGR